MDNVSLKKFVLFGDFVGLVYSDYDVIFVSRKDFDRAFGAIVSASKNDVVRDFVID